MTANDFNAERARNGEPVQFWWGSESNPKEQKWIDVHFVGIGQDNTPIVQFPNSSLIQTHALRMKPGVVKGYALIFQSKELAERALEENFSPATVLRLSCPAPRTV